MRKVVRNPLAATDPYAVPYLSGNSWWDFGFGPVCRRLLAKYGGAVEAQQLPAPSPAARAAVGTDPAEVGMLPFEAFGPQERAS